MQKIDRTMSMERNHIWITANVDNESEFFQSNLLLGNQTVKRNYS